MSQYSETMGSFIRTGNYPLEANYIFSTEAELKEFYEDPINATTLHKGLLKVVENDDTDNQALYWVTKKETTDELEFTKLISGSDTSDLLEKLQELSDKLDKTIENQDNINTSIWGADNPLTIDTDLNSIKDLSDAITNLKDQLEDTSNLQQQISALAGTESSDVISYLKTIPYSSLTDVGNALNKYVSELRHTDTNLQTELDQTQVGVGLSQDGSYSPDQETNYLKNATSVMNALKTLDALIKQAMSSGGIRDAKVSTTDATLDDDGYIIDGTGNPALCMSYLIEDGTYRLVTIDYQSFSTSLTWEEY